MSPTLIDGGHIPVERIEASRRLRDGTYVPQRDGGPLVKRVTLTPRAGRLHIANDNPAYPSWPVARDNPAYPIWPNCDAADVQIIGRAGCRGRKHG